MKSSADQVMARTPSAASRLAVLSFAGGAADAQTAGPEKRRRVGPAPSSAGAGALFNASGSNFHMLFVIIPEGSQQGHPGMLACFSR